METVLITGGTGLIGKALTAALLERGYRVIILTRNSLADQKSTDNPFYAKWDIKNQVIDTDAISSADYIVHLAGASVAEKRWTTGRKKEIIDSRVGSGKRIVESLQTIPNKVKAVISISGIGWYGADPEIPNHKPFTESAAADKNFLGETCRQWEAVLAPLSFIGKRVVIFRTGIVLSNDGGAFTEFIKPLRYGVATILGNGNQMISWIHIDDLVRQFLFAISNETMDGVYNAVAPAPVSNKELMLMLAKELKGKFFVPVYVPAFILKIMLGELSCEVLKSTTVSAERIQQAGFIFQYPDLQSAMQQLLQKK
jgi:uncharacterized protein (TIGR01777 family)